jgi:flagellar biosynthesis GTPase FlhF
LGILTAVSIASGTLSLGEKNAFNAKKVPIETRDDTDVDTDTETDESSCDLEENEVQQEEVSFRIEESVHEVKEQEVNECQQAEETEKKAVEIETVPLNDVTVYKAHEDSDVVKGKMVEVVTVKNETTWEWPDLFTRIRRFRFSERLEI